MALDFEKTSKMISYFKDIWMEYPQISRVGLERVMANVAFEYLDSMNEVEREDVLRENMAKEIKRIGRPVGPSYRTATEFSYTDEFRVIRVVDGASYPSIQAAARANNVTPAAIQRAIKNPKAKSCGSRWAWSKLHVAGSAE